MTLLEAVSKQIFNTMKLDLSSFTLTRLGSPIVYIDLNKNKLKVEIHFKEREREIVCDE